MKAMLAAFATTALIAVVAYFGLHEVGFGSGEHTASDAVRLGD